MRAAGGSRTLLVVFAGMVMLAASACEPMVNEPPGGGQTLSETFLFGPFTLGPGEEVSGSEPSGMPRPAGAFGLKGANFAVVDQDGAPVDQLDVHLHQLVMTTSARMDQLCPGRKERFLTAGRERTLTNLWGPYTYLVGEDDEWGAIYEIENETAPGTPPMTVYIRYTIDFQPGADAVNSRALDVYFHDVTGCGNSHYDVPGDGGPGSVQVTSQSWTAPQDGLTVYGGGHLHEGGIDVALRDSTTRLLYCRGTATYENHPYHLATIGGCLMHHKVTAGNVLELTARYDNSQPRTDVEGIMLTYIWWGVQ